MSDTNDTAEHERLTDEMTSDEYRERLMDTIKSCDGAFVVAAKLNNVEDATEVTVARFIDDDIEGDDKMNVVMGIGRACDEEAPGLGGSDGVPDELLESLRDALMADSGGEGDLTASTDAGGMFQ